MNHTSHRMDNILRWAARIWSLPAILFVLGEFLFPHGGDSPVPFIEWLTLGLQLTAVIGLAIAWRWEVIGGSLSILTLLSSLVLFVFTRSGELLLQIGWIWLVFVLLPAAIFLVCGLRSRPANLKPA